MSKLLIVTQVYENYGEADNPYWKPKGGNDYMVKNFRGNRRPSLAESAEDIIMSVRDQVEINNPYHLEYIIDWKIVADDYLTEFERSQLEYDGRITYPAKELVLSV